LPPPPCPPPPGEETFHTAKVSEELIESREPLPELLAGPRTRHGLPWITRRVKGPPHFHSYGVEQPQSVPIVSNAIFPGGEDIHAGVLTECHLWLEPLDEFHARSRMTATVPMLITQFSHQMRFCSR
jgi:hypothetical protein